MFRISFPVVLVSLLSGFAGSTPAVAADLCYHMAIQCNGFEPNWQFTTSLDQSGNTIISFVDPENPNWQTKPLVVESCMLQGSPNDFELNTGAPLSLTASITEQNCVEPNDEISDFSINASFNQGALTSNPSRVNGNGCCKRLN